jgi:hypothetical protein
MAGHDSHTLQRLDDCYRQSVRRAVEGLNAPLVTAAYQPAAGARQVARLPKTAFAPAGGAPPPAAQLEKLRGYRALRGRGLPKNRAQRAESCHGQAVMSR